MQIRDFGMRKTRSGNGVKQPCPPSAFGGQEVILRKGGRKNDSGDSRVTPASK